MGGDAIVVRDDLDVRVLGQDFQEALVAVVVRRVAGVAAHVVDRACPAHLLEQPLGAELGVLDLVVVEVVRVRVGDVRIHRDRHDPGRLRFGECRIERGRVVRVEDDRVHALRDQVTDLLELLGRGPVLVDHGQLGDLAGRQRLCLGRAHLLLAEAVADAAGVRVPDLVGGRRSHRGRGRRGRGRRGGGRRGGGGRRTRGARGRENCDGRQADQQSASRSLDHWFSSSCERRADLVTWDALTVPRHGEPFDAIYRSHLLRVRPMEVTPPR